MKRSDQSKISVIIPAYNSEVFLADTLKSVLAQSYKELEVILVDDGSIDNTKEIVDFFLDDSRLKYIFQSNGGLSSARNTGILASTGNAIMFVDSDDLLPNSAIEDLAKNLEKLDSSYCAVHGEMERFQHGSGEALEITNYGDFSQKREKLITLRANFLLTCLIRREAVIKAGMFHVSMKQDAEDYDFIFRLSRLGKFKSIDKVVCKYRIHSTSKSQNLSLPRMTTQIKERHQMFCRVLPNENWSIRLRSWAIHYMWAGVDIHRYNPAQARYYWFRSILFNPFQLVPIKLIRASFLRKI